MVGPMRISRVLSVASAVLALSATCAKASTRTESGIDLTQVPQWKRADLEFFLHGSMGTEVIPERVLNAFVATYPDLYPTKNLSNFGLIRWGQIDTAQPAGLDPRNPPITAAIGFNCWVVGSACTPKFSNAVAPKR